MNVATFLFVLIELLLFLDDLLCDLDSIEGRSFADLIAYAPESGIGYGSWLLIEFPANSGLSIT